MKKIFSCLAVVTCLGMVLSACGNDETTPNVVLGQYKGVEVTVPAVEEVTEEDIDTEIRNVLIEKEKSTTETLESGTVEDGDTVNIDYVGKIDGVAFENGSDTDFDLTIGSNQFIDGFESSLIGKEIGTTVDIDVTFPDPYENNPDLAGKPAVFTVTIHSAQRTTVPELTDELVQEISDEYTTVAEYRESIRQQLQEENENIQQSNTALTIWTTVKNNATVNNYPEEDVQKYVDDMTSYYTDYATMFGMELGEFLESYMGTTEEEFNSQVQTYAKDAVAEELIIQAIAEQENITISDEEYQTGLAEYAAAYSYDSTEDFENDYGKEEIQKRLLADKVIEFVVDQAVTHEEGSN